MRNHGNPLVTGKEVSVSPGRIPPLVGRSYLLYFLVNLGALPSGTCRTIHTPVPPIWGQVGSVEPPSPAAPSSAAWVTGWEGATQEAQRSRLYCLSSDTLSNPFC